MGKATAEETPAQTIARHVVAYREERSLTRPELAELMGVHPSRVARIERGADSPSLDTLARVAVLLGTEITVSVSPDGGKPTHLRKKARGKAIRTSDQEARITLVAG